MEDANSKEDMMAKSDFEKFVDAKLEEQRREIVEEAKTQYLSSLPDYNVPLGAFIEQMRSEGLWDSISGMSLVELADIVNPPTGGRRSGRLTKAQKGEILDRIPLFLEKNSWSRKGDIARALNVDAKKLGGPLRELVGAKRLKKQGQRGATRYTLVGDKTKPE
jgi:hypothetical protein